MSVDYLLQENGGRILLESGDGALLLETSGDPAPSVFGGGGGGGGPFYDPRDHRPAELWSWDDLTEDEELLLAYLMGQRW